LGGGDVQLQVRGDALPNAADGHGADHAVAVDGGLALEGGDVGDATLDDACRDAAQRQRAAKFEDGGEL
jgi:hypothetical protein